MAVSDEVRPHLTTEFVEQGDLEAEGLAMYCVAVLLLAELVHDEMNHVILFATDFHAPDY